MKYLSGFIILLIFACTNNHDTMLFSKLKPVYSLDTISDGGMFPNQHILTVVNILTAKTEVVKAYDTPPSYLCNNKPFTGETIEYYNDVKGDIAKKLVYFKGHLKDGFQIDTWLVYNKEGKVIREVNFDSTGRITGKYVYSQDGISKDSIIIENPIFDTRIIWYDIPKKNIKIDGYSFN